MITHIVIIHGAKRTEPVQCPWHVIRPRSAISAHVPPVHPCHKQLRGKRLHSWRRTQVKQMARGQWWQKHVYTVRSVSQHLTCHSILHATSCKSICHPSTNRPAASYNIFTGFTPKGGECPMRLSFAHLLFLSCRILYWSTTHWVSLSQGNTTNTFTCHIHEDGPASQEVGACELRSQRCISHGTETFLVCLFVSLSNPTHNSKQTRSVCDVLTWTTSTPFTHRMQRLTFVAAETSTHLRRLPGVFWCDELIHYGLILMCFASLAEGVP